MKRSKVIFDQSVVKEARALRKRGSSMHAKKYLEAVTKLCDRYPYEPYLHAWRAAVYGDYAQTFPVARERKMKREAVKALRGISHSPLMKIPEFRGLVINEICYHSQDFLGQFRLGQKEVRERQKGGWFSQGVGAAEHAYRLFAKKQIQASRTWAKKSLKAWSHYDDPVTIGSSFFALALALAGDHSAAEAALDRIESDDKHRKAHARWHKKYRDRLAQIKKAE